MSNINNNYNNKEIDVLIDEKINLATELIDKLDKDFAEVEGCTKTKRSVEKELKFLKKVSFLLKIQGNFY